MLGSRTRIYTPEGYERICKLKPNDEVIAWDGRRIQITKIQQVIKHNYELTDLYKFFISLWYRIFQDLSKQHHILLS